MPLRTWADRVNMLRTPESSLNGVRGHTDVHPLMCLRTQDLRLMTRTLLPRRISPDEWVPPTFHGGSSDAR